MITPSPLQELFTLTEGEARLFMKRDDLNHPEIQGNKWRKLAPIIPEILNQGKGLFSFGGPFSNHLRALAAAGRIYSFPTAALVRGVSADLDNPVLSFAQQCGMQLFPVPKADYDFLKNAAPADLFQYLSVPYPNQFQILPEGGDTPQALLNCTSIAAEIRQQLPAPLGSPVFICVSAGTGCTAAGVIAGARTWAKVLVFPAAPYGVETSILIEKLHNAGIHEFAEFEIMKNMYPTKFAQMPPELKKFICAFEALNQFKLDPIYTSKMMFKLDLLVKTGYFPPKSIIVAVHTGGTV
ncbi:MAG: pyridoxal-phosphate dependent enzyme [Saprospiraceae bacterium]|nr:pyridoxal-phosphate dependent enzyme [Saprospiraceae bacterium]